MLHELHAQGVSISAIARQTGLDRFTVYLQTGDELLSAGWISCRGHVSADVESVISYYSHTFHELVVVIQPIKKFLNGRIFKSIPSSDLILNMAA